MTDEAMNMAAETAAVPEAAPVEQAAPEIDRSSEATPRNSIDRAFDALDNSERDTPEQPAKVEAETTDERPRTPDGKFAKKEPAEGETEVPEEATAEDAAKELTNFVEPPSRFSADAKQAWKDAPEPVRAEITRALSELENGINQYREAYEPFKAFADKVKEGGGKPGEVLNYYTNMEGMMYQNPIQGLDAVIGNMKDAGLLQVGTLRELVSVMSGQTPDQNAVLQDQTIRELRNEIASLKQEVTGVSTNIKTQAEGAALKEIEAFAAQNPRFEELSNDIAFFLDNGRAKTLQEAYGLAERLNPAPQAPAPAQPAAEAATPAAPAQTRKGNLSLSGAPSSGSNPANRKTPSSAREALDNAFASVGL